MQGREWRCSDHIAGDWIPPVFSSWLQDFSSCPPRHALWKAGLCGGAEGSDEGFAEVSRRSAVSPCNYQFSECPTYVLAFTVRAFCILFCFFALWFSCTRNVEMACRWCALLQENPSCESPGCTQPRPCLVSLEPRFPVGKQGWRPGHLAVSGAIFECHALLVSSVVSM